MLYRATEGLKPLAAIPGEYCNVNARTGMKLELCTGPVVTVSITIPNILDIQVYETSSISVL